RRGVLKETPMYSAPEQFTAFSKTNLETAMSLANIALQGTGRMLDLQMKAVKEALASSTKNAKALSEVHDLQQVLALQSILAQPTLERAIEYSRDAYEVANETQVEFTRLIEARLSELNTNFVAAVDKAA